MNSLTEFFASIVSPFVREFEADKASLKKAYGAAWALDSFASRIHCSFRNKLSGYRTDFQYKDQVLRPASADFKLLGEVSAATKHGLLLKSDGTPRSSSVNASSDVTSANLEGWSAYFANVDPADWGDQVIINNEAHLFRPFLPVVLGTETFLLQIKVNLEA